jgi:hypothetical protein
LTILLLQVAVAAELPIHQIMLVVVVALVGI